MKANKEYKNLIGWLKNYEYEKIISIYKILGFNKLIFLQPINKRREAEVLCSEIEDLLIKLKEGKVIIVDQRISRAP